MSINITKESFFDVLQKAFPVIPLKSSLQILSNFRIVCSDSKLEITATDLDQSIRILAVVEGDDTFDVTVNARKLFEIVRELPGGNIIISVEENILVIKSEKNFNCKIAGADAHDFPGFPEVYSGIDFEINHSLLKTMINKSSFAVANDETRACLAGVLWEVYSDKSGMVATDGHRLGSCFIKNKFSVKDKTSGIISPKSLNQMIKLIDSKQEENLTVVINEKYVSFSGKTFTFCSKLVEGPYPDYTKVIPSSNPKEAVVERMSLVNAVKRASVLSNQKTHLIKFCFSENQLEIMVVNKEIGGEAREKIEISYRNDAHTIGFNGLYFNEILDIVKTPRIKLKMNTQISACLIFPEHDIDEEVLSEDLFLIMPLRIMEG
jgi:DNA polymerase-3 subunit beta